MLICHNSAKCFSVSPLSTAILNANEGKCTENEAKEKKTATKQAQGKCIQNILNAEFSFTTKFYLAIGCIIL